MFQLAPVCRETIPVTQAKCHSLLPSTTEEAFATPNGLSHNQSCKSFIFIVPGIPPPRPRCSPDKICGACRRTVGDIPQLWTGNRFEIPQPGAHQPAEQYF